MSPHVVLLNGPPGVGKTTVAAHLAALAARTVDVSGDALRAFAPEHATTFLGPGSTYVAGAALADAYLRMGAERVIFDYVFEGARQVRYFLKALTANVPVHLVTLWAPRDVVERRERQRPDRTPLGPRLGECYRRLESNLPELGNVVATDGRASEDIARFIHTSILRASSRSESHSRPEDPSHEEGR